MQPLLDCDMSAKVRGIPFGFDFRKGDLWPDTGIKIFQIKEMARFKEWQRENLLGGQREGFIGKVMDIEAEK